MTPEEVRQCVESQIGDRWDETNAHGVDLRKCLVPPRKVKMINRKVVKGKLKDSVVEVWIVLEETPGDPKGYTILFDEEDRSFGLAS